MAYQQLVVLHRVCASQGSLVKFSCALVCRQPQRWFDDRKHEWAILYAQQVAYALDAEAGAVELAGVRFREVQVDQAQVLDCSHLTISGGEHQGDLRSKIMDWVSHLEDPVSTCGAVRQVVLVVGYFPQ